MKFFPHFHFYDNQGLRLMLIFCFAQIEYLLHFVLLAGGQANAGVGPKRHASGYTDGERLFVLCSPLSLFGSPASQQKL